MKAGRELDTLVAEKVMGWTEIKSAFGDSYYAMGRPPIEDQTDILLAEANIKVMIPDYSTDISEAWEIMDKLRRNDPFGKFPKFIDALAEMFDADQGDYRADLFNVLGNIQPYHICLAALKAAGAEIEETDD